MIFAQIDPEWIGRVAGLVLFSLCAVKCFQVARKPRVQPLCLVALGIVLLVPVTTNLVGMLGNTGALKVAGDLLKLAMMVAAAVLAIIGLVQFRTQRERYERGRGHGIAVLCLVAVFCGFVGLGVYNRNEALKFVEIETTGDRVLLEEFNLSFQAPGRPWVQLDGEQVNPRAKYVVRRTRPEVLVMVLPEISGVENPLTLEGLGEGVRGNILSTATQVEMGESKPTTAAGIAGQRFTVKAKVSGFNLHYEYWYGTHNGLTVQVIAFGEPKAADDIARGHQEFLAEMRLLDGEKIFTMTGELLGKTIEVPKEGFRLKFETARWITSELLEKEFPAAAFTATSIHGANLQVVTLDLQGIDAEMDAIVEALLGAQNIVIEDATLIVKRDIPSTGRLRRDLVLKVGAAPEIYLDHYRFIREGDHVYMINTWIEERLADENWKPEETLNALETFPGTASSEHDQLSIARRTAQAQTINAIGLYYVKMSDFEPAISFFRAASEMDPQNAVLAGNVVYALFSQEKFEEAIEQANACIARFPDHLEPFSEKARSLVALGRQEEAAVVYADVIERVDDDDLLLEYINLLIDLDRVDEAGKVIGAQVARRPSELLRRWQVHVLQIAGDYVAAEEQLKTLGEEVGWNTTLFADAIDLFEKQEDYSRALEWIDRQEEQTGVSFETQMARGRNELDLGWYREALGTFRSALEKKPRDTDAREYVDYVNSLLGRGSSQGVHTEIGPVEIPEALVDALAKIADDSVLTPRAAEAHVWWEQIVQAYELDKEGRYRRTEHKTVRVETRNGVNQFSTLRLRFNPRVERIFVNRVEVTGPDGKSTSVAEPEDFYVLDSSEEVPGDGKILNVPVPGVRPGCRIEYVVTWESRGRHDEMPYEEVFFFKQFPAQAMAVSVRTPNDDLIFASDGVAEPTSSDGARWWLTTPVKMAPREFYMPRLHDRGPWLMFGGSGKSWEQVGSTYLADLAKHLAPSKEVGPLAAKLFADLESTGEKQRQALRYVRDELSYQAVSFGVRGVIPNECGTILTNRFGDCKDHALLAYHLLREAGLDPRLALVRTDGSVVSKHPSLGQFDHMIVAWKQEGSYRFYDPTDKYTHATSSPPLALGGQYALVLDPEGSALVRIEDYPSDFAKLVVDKEIFIDQSGGMTVKETVVASGQAASYLRSWLSSVEPGERAGSFTRVFSEYGPLVVTDVASTNLSVLDEPLLLELEYAVTSVDAGNNTRLLHLPEIWASFHLPQLDQSSRANPVRIEYPLLLESRTNVKIDPRIQAEVLAGDGKLQETSNYLEWHVEKSRKEGQIFHKMTIRLPASLLPADRYQDYQKACSAALEGVSSRFLIHMPNTEML